ncbi:tRNA-splicing endonuclease subunit Sen2p [Trichomonascus vanleenenianus]|uniref:tRNA splicing endonuclease subunit SEN2 n=1 Tax=Trichomonascus vanleenenianus TaxID=2268995 RepID=UPI003ECA8909
MGKPKKNLNGLFKYPLPVEVKALPPVFLHNPLSVLWFVYAYFCDKPEKIVCKGDLVTADDGTCFVKVTDEFSINALWSMGFFGKGTLSRSEPSWFIRTARRLGLKGGDKITAEDITEARRRERKKFKKERARAEQEELERRRALDAGVSTSSAPQPSDIIFGEEDEEEELTASRRAEDEVIIEEEKLVQQEYLQLMPVEALFLAYGLGALEVESLSVQELLNVFSSHDDKFLYHYVAYHHFRSRGWCVRNGVKFGVDYMLYKRGPPFSHAEFSVIVIPSKEANPNKWWWNGSIGRVIGGVKKTLVFCYVDLPDSRPATIDDLLRKSFVREVVYRRWVANRNRD